MRLLPRAFVLGLLLLSISISATGTVIHVPGGHETIQEGVLAASEGDTVLVAPGWYSGPGNRDIEFGGVNLVLVSESGPDVTFVDAQGGPSSGRRGFWFYSGEDSTSVVQGFTILGGYTNYSAGAGIRIDGASPRISECVFLWNHSRWDGGGVSIDGGSPILADCAFIGNSVEAPGLGSALFCQSPSARVKRCSFDVNSGTDAVFCGSGAPTFEDCTFFDNDARGMYCSDSQAVITECSFLENHGGGMLCYGNTGGSPTITGCTFSSNSAGQGAGLRCEWSHPTVISCTFIANEATMTGGGVYLFGASPTFTGCVFAENSAGGGGGIRCSGGSPIVTDCAFTANAASGPGGGIYFSDDAAADVIRCTFFENTAGFGGGVYSFYAYPEIIESEFLENVATTGAGVCFAESGASLELCVLSQNEATNGGGGLYCLYDDKEPTITRCTFTRNTAAYGGGLCFEIFGDPWYAPVATNNIIAFGTGGGAIYCGAGADPTISHCISFDNTDGNDLCGNDVENLFSDPCFCDVMGGDHTLCSNSPGLPHNNSWNEAIGALGEGCGPCDGPVEQMSWGAIKAIFR